MKYTIQSILSLLLTLGVTTNIHTEPRSKRLNQSDERPFFEQLREESGHTSNKNKNKKEKSKKSSCGCKAKK